MSYSSPYTLVASLVHITSLAERITQCRQMLDGCHLSVTGIKHERAVVATFASAGGLNPKSTISHLEKVDFF